MAKATKYPEPGRGAWRLAGGLLLAKPGQKGKIGYYRQAVAAQETPVGAGWCMKADRSHDAEAVWYGVLALQQLVGISGPDRDGWLGSGTSKAIVRAQGAAGVEADGIVGPTTMRALLTPLVMDIAAANDVPAKILGGLITNESGLDPAAVGVNGQDHGLAQINLGAHGDTVTLAQAMDPGYALHWSAEELSMTFRRWYGKTKNDVDPWVIAVANHNSPKLAKQWATTGEAPYVEGRVFQISEYVDKVMTSW
jgi:hypothetical protein